MLLKTDFRAVGKKPNASDEGELIYYEQSTHRVFARADEIDFRLIGKLMIFYDLNGYIIPVVDAR